MTLSEAPRIICISELKLCACGSSFTIISDAATEASGATLLILLQAPNIHCPRSPGRLFNVESDMIAETKSGEARAFDIIAVNENVGLSFERPPPQMNLFSVSRCEPEAAASRLDAVGAVALITRG
jgi:hypothetical protein